MSKWSVYQCAPSSGLPVSSPRLSGYGVLGQVRAEALLRDNGALEKRLADDVVSLELVSTPANREIYRELSTFPTPERKLAIDLSANSIS